MQYQGSTVQLFGWSPCMIACSVHVYNSFVGPTNYLITDADALKQILVTKSFKYHSPTDSNKSTSTKNVLQANGKEHSRMRKMLNPIFSVNNLKYKTDTFHKKAKLLAKVS